MSRSMAGFLVFFESKISNIRRKTRRCDTNRNAFFIFLKTDTMRVMSKRETPQPFPSSEGPEKRKIIEALTRGDDKALEQAGGELIRGLSKKRC